MIGAGHDVHEAVQGPSPALEDRGGAGHRWPLLGRGGMGVGVSGWRLARAVARTGRLGMVPGTALDVTPARRLQRGDPGGHLRRAPARFPVPELAERVPARCFVPGGLPSGAPYRPVPRLGLRPHRERDEPTVVADFTEVFLAKEGHDGPVGIDHLEKIQTATPAAVHGAMLAGADHVVMGAGIPAEIPRLLDAPAENRPAEISVTLAGAPSGERHTVGVDPVALLGRRPGPPRRPRLLAVVSSHVPAAYPAQAARTRPDGFVPESPPAGGHGAPSRDRLRLAGRHRGASPPAQRAAGRHRPRPAPLGRPGGARAAHSRPGSGLPVRPAGGLLGGRRVGRLWQGVTG